MALKCGRVDYWNLPHEIPFEHYQRLLAFDLIEHDEDYGEEIDNGATVALALGVTPQPFTGRF